MATDGSRPCTAPASDLLRSQPLPSLDQTALAQTLAGVDPRATIRPPSLRDTVAQDKAPAVTTKLDPLAQRVELHGTIGQGGMAIVRMATQNALHREVAVKTLKSDADDDAAPRLLREAWITGALEHPNIVPVHDLGADERGRPLIVLKRIEGEPWQPGKRELEENLATLMQVCHAIAFAHSRGIVHRDLKPDNIMIGRFGEVYVLDWGIAVALKDDGSGRMPLAEDAREIAGTLAYMAPEMISHVPPTERTDVFLLGAILYEIAEGKPPHLRGSVAASLVSIAECEPPMTSDTPAELVEICRRAMALSPEERYASADELRVAIAAFLEHRTSAQIARESHERLKELEAQLASPEATRVTMYQLFGQCRFGFQAALRAWDDNEHAREGLDRALAAMAAHELDHGDPRAAAVLIAELKTPRPDLAKRLAEVEQSESDKRKRLERFERDADLTAGQVTRGLFLTLVGVIWSATPLAVHLIPAMKITHAGSFAMPVVMFVFVVGFSIWARDSMTKSAVNRGILLTVILGCVLHAATEAIGWSFGLDLPTTHLMDLAMWAGVTAVAAVFLERSLWLPVVGFIITCAITLASPDRRWWGMSATCFSVLAIAVYSQFGERSGRKIYGIAEMLRRKD